MRLHPGRAPLRLRSGELQFGSDPRWAVRLSDLDEAEIELLEALTTTGSEALLARAEGQGRDVTRLTRALVTLREAGTLIDVGGPEERSGRRPAPGDAARIEDDVLCHGAVAPDGDGRRRVEARSRRRVGVSGLGRLGLSTALTVAAAGVGTLVLHDRALVAPADVAPGGYRPADVGRPRREAAAHALTRGTRARVGGRLDVGDLDLVVLVEHGAMGPVTAARLLASGVPHLAVVVRASGVEVGPLVLPGRTPCLHCVDLHRRDADPAWPQLSARLSAPTPAGHRGPPEETVLSALGSALAAAQVLSHLDGDRTHTAGASLEALLPDGVPRSRSWAVHPDCGCTALPGA